MHTTWMPHEKHGQLTAQSDLPDTVYAFPKQRKEPLTDAEHVRNAVARFDQVTGVSDADRALAFANIEKAAKHYDVDLSETSWRDLGAHNGRRLLNTARSRRARREKRGLRAAQKGPSRASSSKIPRLRRYRAAETQPLRAAMRHGRRRETPRTRLAHGRQPPSRSPVPGRLARQDTEFGIAGDQTSPKLRAWVRFACNVAGAARAPPKRQLRESGRSRRPPPSGSRRRDQCFHEHCRQPAEHSLVFSPSRRNRRSVPLGAP
jgi:hypothetical protein